jgi:pSer/pThr/pTyr-binding forkhead associated (FHA) protein
LDDDHAMQPVKRDFSVASLLESRVIEVKRRKSEKAKNTITIGRAATNDIVLYNSTISKAHAYLYIHPSKTVCYLVDCDSKNGTLLNGEVLKPFERYKVADCDEICFGPQTKIVYFSSIAFANFINQLRATHSA